MKKEDHDLERLNTEDEFVTQHELKQIMTDFEQNMQDFDIRTKRNTNKLEEVEKKIDEIPTLIEQVQRRITALFSYLSDGKSIKRHEDPPAFSPDKLAKGKYFYWTHILMLLLIIVVIISMLFS